MKNLLDLLEQGFQTYQAGNYRKAEELCRQALVIDPENIDGLNLLSVLVSQSGNAMEAIELLEKAIQINPRNADFFNNIGQLYKGVGRFKDAIKAYSQALKIRPNFSEAHSNFANAMSAVGDNKNALIHYRTALQIDPGNTLAQYNLATTLSMLGNHSLAIEAFRAILILIPDHFEAHNNLAFSLLEQGIMDEASKHLKRALEINPEFSAAYANLGILFAKLSDWRSSFKYYNEATILDPDRAEAWTGLGNAQENLGNTNDALVSYHRAVDADPENGNALGALCNQLMGACDWDKLIPALERLDELSLEVNRGDKKFYENPLMSLTRTCDLRANAVISRSWSNQIKHAVAGLDLTFSMKERRQFKPVLTIGYLSSDFRNHVVGNLMYEIFPLHNRKAFRIIAYSSGGDDGSDCRKGIRENCDLFIDINGRSSMDVAQRINNDQVDILVDLNGYTVGSRLEIAALRPAPVQIQYLGFPGTVADFFDYLFLDKVVLDKEEEIYFCEKVIYLPPYYCVNNGLPKVTSALKRKDYGLPDNGFVFCSFNKANKIEPVMFECWMNLLERTPGSVLWLVDDNPVATQNLKQAAAGHGVAPERLIFAGKVQKKQHIARHKLADLGLDTRLYNGGVTTWDALSIGLPVITVRGQNIPSRATASMLTSLGVEELITYDLDAYKALALKLATNVKELESIRDKIRKNAKTSTLFNTEASVRNLENAYQRVWKNFARGIKPHSIKV